MKTNFVSSKTLIHEFRRKVGNNVEVNKADILASADDALDRILTDEQLEHKIALIPVDNYKALLPHDFKTVCQVAYRNQCDFTNSTVAKVHEITQEFLGNDCKLKIQTECKCGQSPCDCNTNIVTVDTDRIFEMNNPQLLHGYMNHFYSYGQAGSLKKSNYHPDFQLIRYSTSSFFSVPYHISECVNFNLDCSIEYMIERPNLILNVKDGEILLSYYAVKKDEEGYRYLPEDNTVTRAVLYSILMDYFHAKWIQTGERKDENAFNTHVHLTEKWVSRARQRLQTLEFDEMHSIVTGFIHRIVPRYNYWEQGFKHMNDKFKYPGESYNLRGYKNE